jgi:hypothetical protein
MEPVCSFETSGCLRATRRYNTVFRMWRREVGRHWLLGGTHCQDFRHDDTGYEFLTAVVMKSSIFWSTVSSRGFSLSPAFTLVSRSVYSSTLKWRRYFPPKHWLTFRRLHGVISQKIRYDAVGTCSEVANWNGVADTSCARIPTVALIACFTRSVQCLPWNPGVLFGKGKKVKLSLWSGCIDPHFLDLGTSWRWVVSFTPLPLYTRERAPPYPFYSRLGGPQSRSERYGEVKIFYPTGTRDPAPPGRPARSQSLYRLSYPGVLFGRNTMLNRVVIMTDNMSNLDIGHSQHYHFCNDGFRTEITYCHVCVGKSGWSSTRNDLRLIKYNQNYWMQFQIVCY